MPDALADSRIPIATVQSNPLLGDLDHNRRAILNKLASAAQSGARLVVFPECSLSGYVLNSRAEALPLAEPPDGPTIRALEAACAQHNISAIVGLLLAENDHLYNACVLIAPDGLAGIYRKTHLPRMGVDRFVDPGNALPQVTTLAGLRVAPLICYDGAFPEPSRALALAGADLIVLPTNWPEGAEPLAQHLMPCRALENVVYTLTASRIGTERGVRFIGGSAIYDPFGRTLVQLADKKEAIAHAAIDPTLARSKRILRASGSMEFNRIADRRPELYGSLTDTVSPATRR